MATTDYDFNLTRTQILERAYRIVGAIGEGQPLSATQTEQGRIALNALIKQWQTKGIFLWTLVKKTQALLAADPDYVLGNDVIGIDRAWYQLSGDDIPVQVISYRQYEYEIVDKADVGEPTMVAIDYHLSTPTMYVWPVQSSSLTLEYLAIVRLQDMDTTTGTPDIPQQFLDALVYGAASNLADEYGTPMREREYIQSKADDLFQIAKASNKEYEELPMVMSAFPNR